MNNQVQRWHIDPAHSEIRFKVKHMMISTVTGSFKKFSATVESPENGFDNARIMFEADVSSIDTGMPDRDNHLKSDDFFNAQAYPRLTFVSTSMERKSEEEYVLKGRLTIRDVTKDVTLQALYGGTADDGYGNTKAGFEIQGKIRRKDFNLRWDMVTEAGSIVVSDEVTLMLNVQLILAKQ